MDKGTETTAAPPLFRRHVRRPRLTALLDESTAQAIVLTAPAGYGKTVLAQEWLTGHPNAAWYRASPASADVAAFSVGVADAVAPIVPNAGDRLRQRLRVAGTPEKLVRPLAELLAEDLTSWPEDAWLVVDDYHLVTDSAAVEEFVDWLLTLAPVRLLVTTRRRPSWASARRVLYGEITEIGRDQLAMTNDEASRVLDGRSSDAVRALVAQAEGWPALIGLAALSASSELPRERVSDALFRYFAEEVFRREPPEVQHFMLVASIPVSLNAEVVRDVLGFADAESLLQRLEDDGLLHRADGRDTRFHPLLRDFLRKKIQLENADLVRSLSDGALAHSRRIKRWDEAFALAIESDRVETAAQIAGDAAAILLASGRMETLQKWLSETGPHAINDPGAVLAKIDICVRQGRFLEAIPLATSLAGRLPDQHAYVSRAWHRAGQAFNLSGDFANALDCHLHGKRLARSRDDVRQALWGAFLAAADLGRVDASRYLDEFEAMAADDLDGKLRIAIGKFNIGVHNGSLQGVWSLFEPLVPLAEHASDVMARSNFWNCAAVLSLGRGKYESAAEFATRATSVCVDLHLDFAKGYCLAARGGAEIGLRQFQRADRTLNVVARLAVELDDAYLHLENLLQVLRLLLAKRQFGAARNAITSLPDRDFPPEPYGAALGLLAIAAAMNGDTDAARAAIHKARSITSAVGAIYYSRFAEMVLSALRNGGEANHSTVCDLIEDCAEADFLDAWVTAYRACPRLLGCLAGRERACAITRGAAYDARDTALLRRAGIDTHAPPSHCDQLTPRELEVLALMSEGLTNQEIATQLVISPSTAKVHVHHVLEKLGAKTRLQAVLVGKDFIASR